ncbi:hypothetical protein ACFL2U_01285 [Patescibacteria group bacterium]
MPAKRGNIPVVLENRGALTLRPNDHVATGGEGSVYRAKNTMIKLYTDPNKMKNDGMAEKIKLLTAINHKFIVAPAGLVTSNSGTPVGYYMPYAKGEPLPRVFTNDFRKRENFTDQHASTLVDYMRQTVDFAHSQGAILVDANEMNWLVALSKKGQPEPRIIDVDSWQIGRWPGKVIMMSIRDWLTKGFNQESDWFAWGIVTFQVYTGIHPYKGKLTGYKPNDMEKRMKAKASVFSPDVRLNRAVRDFSVIPGPLLDWYVATFQDGERTKPPSPFDTGLAKSKVARVLHAITTATGMLIYEKLLAEPNDPAIRVFPCGVTLLNSGKLIDLAKKRQIATAKTRNCEIIQAENGWLKAEIIDQQLEFTFINSTSLKQEVLKLNLTGQQVFRADNRLFVVTEKGLTEISLKFLGKPLLSVGKTWGVMTNSTRWFDGLGIQDTMGATYMIAPFNETACAEFRVPELDGLKPIMAKAGHRYMVIIALDKQGNYQKVELTMARDYKTYQVWQEITDSPDLNQTILPKGVCASITQDGELHIFVPSSSTQNKVNDKNIATDMLLSNWDNKVIYLQNGEVWKVRMK